MASEVQGKQSPVSGDTSSHVTVGTPKQDVMQSQPEIAATAQNDNEGVVKPHGKDSLFTNIAPPVPIISDPEMVAITSELLEPNVETAAGCLEQSLSEGHITNAKCSFLKKRFQKMLLVLNRKRESGAVLLQRAKNLKTEIGLLTQTLGYEEIVPADIESAPLPMQLRFKILGYQNELALASDHQYELEFKIKLLQDEKAHLMREYSHIPKEEDIVQWRTVLMSQKDELHDEVAAKRREIAKILEDIVADRKVLSQSLTDLAEDNKRVATLQTKVEEVSPVPMHYSKQASRIKPKKDAISRDISELEKKILAIEEELKESSKRRDELQAAKDDQIRQFKKVQSGIDADTRKVNQLMKEFDMIKEKESELVSERVDVDIKLRHLANDKRDHLHHRSVLQRDHDSLAHSHSTAKKQLEAMKGGMKSLQSTVDVLRSELARFAPERETLLLERHSLHFNVEGIRKELVKQLHMNKQEASKLNFIIAEEDYMHKVLDAHRKQVHELHSMFNMKITEKNSKALDVSRLLSRLNHCKDAVKKKDMELCHILKEHQSLEEKTKDYYQLYEVVRSERNNYVHILQLSRQKETELNERIKILTNEYELLQQAATEKECSLARQKINAKQQLETVSRISKDIANQRHINDELHSMLKNERNETTGHTTAIRLLEQEMMSMKRRYDVIVQQRNTRGIQLIERTNELSLFQEKANIQQTTLLKGTVMLNQREDDVKFFTLQVADEKRQIELLQQMALRNHPNAAEVERLQSEILKVKQKLYSMSNASLNAKKFRYLDKQEPSFEELQAKLHVIEAHLSRREETIMEKQLIFEQLTNMVERLRQSAEASTAEEKDQSMEVITLKYRVKNSNRQLKATVAELSMMQAECLKLQQEIQANGESIQQMYTRMDAGEAPSVEFEEAWYKKMRYQEIMETKREKDKQMDDEEDMQTLPNGQRTTAQLRPKYYQPVMATDKMVPVPQPYGAYSPYFPKPYGAHIRHYRKPQVKRLSVLPDIGGQSNHDQ